MTEFEKVEKLCEKANVSYEEARHALEQTDGDLLEAIVLLEQLGKVNKNSAHHTTKEEPVEDETQQKDSFSDQAARLWKKIARIISIGNENHLVIMRKGETLLTLPVTVLVLLLLFVHVFLIVALVVGLFFGVRYSFKGEQLGRESVNEAMKKAADVADCMRESVEEEFKK